MKTITTSVVLAVNHLPKTLQINVRFGSKYASDMIISCFPGGAL